MSIQRHPVPAYVVPPHPGLHILCLGMNFRDLAGQPPYHMDDVRLRMLGSLYPNSMVKSIGSRRLPATPTYRHSDVSKVPRAGCPHSQRSTRGSSSDSWIFDAYGSEIVTLDYYWLPRTYFEDSNDDNGFGTAWFKPGGQVQTLLGDGRSERRFKGEDMEPSVLKPATRVILLPNAPPLRALYVRWQESLRAAGVGTAVLTEAQAQAVHPLTIATLAAEMHTDWPHVARKKSAEYFRPELSNGREYLVPGFPFMLLYNAREESADSAMEFLKECRRAAMST